MILASDLRIGNWSYYPHLKGIRLYFFDKVRAIDSNSFSLEHDYGAMSIESFKPIDFSNQWLDRFGFEKRENSTWWHKGNFTYWQDQNTWYWRMEAINPDLTKYVHQIQNLYYSLTGEEI